MAKEYTINLVNKNDNGKKDTTSSNSNISKAVEAGMSKASNELAKVIKASLKEGFGAKVTTGNKSVDVTFDESRLARVLVAALTNSKGELTKKDIETAMRDAMSAMVRESGKAKGGKVELTIPSKTFDPVVNGIHKAIGSSDLGKLFQAVSTLNKDLSNFGSKASDLKTSLDNLAKVYRSSEGVSDIKSYKAIATELNNLATIFKDLKQSQQKIKESGKQAKAAGLESYDKISKTISSNFNNASKRLETAQAGLSKLDFSKISSSLEGAFKSFIKDLSGVDIDVDAADLKKAIEDADGVVDKLAKAFNVGYQKLSKISSTNKLGIEVPGLDKLEKVNDVLDKISTAKKSTQDLFKIDNTKSTKAIGDMVSMIEKPTTMSISIDKKSIVNDAKQAGKAASEVFNSEFSKQAEKVVSVKVDKKQAEQDLEKIENLNLTKDLTINLDNTNLKSIYDKLQSLKGVEIDAPSLVGLESQLERFYKAFAEFKFGMAQASKTLNQKAADDPGIAKLAKLREQQLKKLEGLADRPEGARGKRGEVGTRSFIKEASTGSHAFSEFKKVVSSSGMYVDSIKDSHSTTVKDLQKRAEKEFHNLVKAFDKLDTSDFNKLAGKAAEVDASADKAANKIKSTAESVKSLSDNFTKIASYAESFKQPTKVITGMEDLKSYKQSLEGAGTKIPSEIRNSMLENVTNMTKSLDLLKEEVFAQLQKGLSQNKYGWRVSGRTASEAFKSTDTRSQGLNIVNERILASKYGATTGTTSQKLSTALSKEATEKASKLNKQELMAAISEWAKKAPSKRVSNVPNQELRLILGKLKTDDSSALSKKTEEQLRDIFIKTKGIDVARSSLTKAGALKRVELPNISLLHGAPTLGTAFGNRRAIPKFGTYKTGFETVFEEASKNMSKEAAEKFKESFQGVKTFRPTTKPEFSKLESLSTDLLKNLSQPKLRSVLEKAAFSKSVKLSKVEGVGADFGSKIEAQILKAIDEGFKTGDVLGSVKKAGLSATEAVQYQDKISFRNFYDVLKDVIAEPIGKIAKDPGYERSYRSLNKAMSQAEQLLPVLPSQQPRRAHHLSNVAKLQVRTGDLYQGMDFPDSDAVKLAIKDLNARMVDNIEEYSELVKRTGPLQARQLAGSAGKRMQDLQLAGIRNVSSIGIPESQAGSVVQYSTGRSAGLDERAAKEMLGEGTDYLKTLAGQTLNVYTDDLRELSPWGKKFQQAGRNISNVSAARGLDPSALSRLGIGPDAYTAPEMPTLRTQREHELIQSGTYGGGYGFNVLAELKHTSDTFEDQILIGGKLAKAVTSMTRTLVKPGVEPGKATEIKPLGEGGKLLRDTRKGQIQEVYAGFQDILGVSQEYKKQADVAFIKEVEEKLATVQGESVEVQSAELAEIFLSHFGRKFTTRFGSKGVSRPSSGLRGALEQFGQSDIGVSTDLGFATLPKTMGELVSETLKAKESEVVKAGFDKTYIDNLRKTAEESGNQFAIKAFRDPTQNFVTEESAKTQAKVFGQIKDVYEKAGLGRLEAGEGGKDLSVSIVNTIKDVYKGTLGEKAVITKQKPIDIRISSYGIGKRGLQTEVLEAITANVAGTQGGGPAVLKTDVGKKDYERLLASAGTEGSLATYSEALGFKGTGKSTKEIEERLKNVYGYGEELAASAAKLEAGARYYTEVVNELGEKYDSIVGTKFVQIVEEPGAFEKWSKQDVQSGARGLKLNIPAYAAYKDIFGEESSLLKEVGTGVPAKSRENVEYITALSTMTSKAVANSKAFKNLEKIDVGAFGSFNDYLITEDQLGKSIANVEKYAKPFKMVLPTAAGGQDELYVPGAAGRQSYADPTQPGKYGLSPVTRALQNIINAAKDISTAGSPEEAEKTISNLRFVRVGENLQKYTDEQINNIFEALKTALENVELDIQSNMEALTVGVKGAPKLKGLLTKKAETASTVDVSKYISAGVLPESVKAGLTEKEAKAAAISKMANLLVGSKTLPDYQSLFEKDDELKKRVTGTLAERKIIGTDKSKAFERLESAKQAYKKQLITSVSGKSGAIAGAVFEKQLPAVIGKATVATVDMSEEMTLFSSTLTALNKEFGDLLGVEGVAALKEVSVGMQEVNVQHQDKLKKLKAADRLILKQEDIGIPEATAKKLPVEYMKRYQIGKEGITRMEEPEKVKGSLFDMLRYAEKLKSKAGDFKEGADISNYIEKELVPYVESVRFPFTGVSSVKPYKPFLTEEKVTGSAYVVPGQPEMDFAAFEKQRKAITDVQKGLVARRESLQEAGTPEASKEIERLTSLINKLNQAISDVIPKYVAHQQKLDFDGDQIEVHTAQTMSSRKDIKKHFDLIHKDAKEVMSRFDTAFSYDAMQPSQEEFQLSYMQKAFEKKFPREKGFSFLESPFITKEMSHLKPSELINILADKEASVAGVGMESAIKNVLELATLKTGVTPLDISALESIKMGTGEDAAKEYKAAIAPVIDEIFSKEKRSVDETLVLDTLRNMTFETKLDDAVEAQLFKVHTGGAVEGLTKIMRAYETSGGLQRGTGLIGAGSDVVGKFTPGHLSKERTQQLNEFYRFAVQKGMDVKHAGEMPVADEIINLFSRGKEGSEQLLGKITAGGSYGGLSEFKEITDEALREQLGEFSTAELRDLVKNVPSFSSIALEVFEKYGADAESDRKAMIDGLVAAFGFEGLIKDLGKTLEDKIIAGGGAGALEEGASLGKYVTQIEDPLYSFRTSGDPIKKQFNIFKGKYGLREGMSEDELSTVKAQWARVGATDIKDIEKLQKGKADPKRQQQVEAKVFDLMFNQALLSVPEDVSRTGAYSEMTSGFLAQMDARDKEIKDFLSSVSEKTDTELMDMAGSPEVKRIAGIVGAPDLLKSTKESIADKYIAEATTEAKKSLGIEGVPTEEQEELVKAKVDAYIKKMQDLERLYLVIDTAKSDVSNELLKSAVSKFPTTEKVPTDFVSTKQSATKMDSVIDTIVSKKSTADKLRDKYIGDDVPFAWEGDPVTKSQPDFKQPPKPPIEDKGKKLEYAGDPIPVIVVNVSEFSDSIAKVLTAGGAVNMNAISAASTMGIDQITKQAAENIATTRSRAFKETEFSTAIEPTSGQDIFAQASNLQKLLDAADEFALSKGMDYEKFKDIFPKDIQESIKSVRETGGPDYEKFMDLTRSYSLIEKQAPGKGMTGGDIFKAWKVYKREVFQALLDSIEEERAEFESLRDSMAPEADIRRQFKRYQASVEKAQGFVKRGAGKRSDVFTDRNMWVDSDLARGAGVYMSPFEIMQQAAGPLGDDPKLIKAYETIVRDLTENIPVSEIRSPMAKTQEAVGIIADIDPQMSKILAGATDVDRLDPSILEGMDLEGLSRRISALRESLDLFKMRNIAEGYQPVQKANINAVIKQLKSIENLTAGRDFGKPESKWGIPGVAEVPKVLAPEQQKMMHMMNIERLKEYFERSSTLGGAKKGDMITYKVKIVGPGGTVVENKAFDFYKYGEELTPEGRKGRYRLKEKDVTKELSERGSFKSAIERAVKWGAASTIVYGGAKQVSASIDTMAEIETSMAQLRMVMNPLTSDFANLQKQAIDFGKQFGTSVQDVLKSMKIFAQQGLSQADIIDRTATATLASNVTTLDASEATEALTSSIKIYGKEGTSSRKYLDAWSNVESKHAITAADMANAVKKSASAAKAAGVDFDQLNGIVAGIGAVTRQTGKEVGTSLRFIFRRLTSEEGEKQLRKRGIATTTAGGDIRGGYDILGDLAEQWDELNNVQRMTMATALGGTRQYNSVLTAMDNWDEVVMATSDSINSQGAAERKNIEIMKTYEKQLEKTKAAAVELQVAFGKVALPVFKTGLKSLTGIMEVISNIPTSFKAAAVGASLFVTYLVKGKDILDSISSFIGGGKSVISGIFDVLKTEKSTAMFELAGKGQSKDVMGLRTVKQYGDTVQGRSLGDFQSTLGKTVYLIQETGKTFNKTLGATTLSPLQKVTGTLSKAAINVGEFLRIDDDVTDALKKFVPLSEGDKPTGADLAARATGLGIGAKELISTFKKEGFKGGVGKALKGGGLLATEALGLGASASGVALDKLTEGLDASRKTLVEDWAGQNTDLLRSIGPMLTAGVALAGTGKVVFDQFQKYSKSAYDFEQAQKPLVSKEEGELTMFGDLERRAKYLEKLRKDAAKESKIPEGEQIERGTFVGSISKISKFQQENIKLANQLAEANINLVSSYDESGNAILKSANNYKTLIKSMQEAKTESLAATKIEILGKYVDEFQKTEDEQFKSTVKKVAKSVPLVGEMLSKGIKVSPAVVLEETTKELNRYLDLKAEYPLSTAVDKDIKRLQGVLKTARSDVQKNVDNMRKAFFSIQTTGLSKEKIAELFNTEEMKDAADLLVKYTPKYTTGAATATGQEFLQSEIFKRTSPKLDQLLGPTREFTEQLFKEQGFAPKAGEKAILSSGDVTLLTKAFAEANRISGAQAQIVKATGEDVRLKYIDKETSQVMERAFKVSDLQGNVDSVFSTTGKVMTSLENVMEGMADFVAGASAGMTGLDTKAVRKDFSLGERFFNEIATTTLIQTKKGFDVVTQSLGDVAYKADYSKEFETFFVEPRKQFQDLRDQMQKIEGGGAEGPTLNIVDTVNQLKALQDVLINNQVVFQFRAAIEDLSKTMEKSTNTLKTNIEVQKMKEKYDKVIEGPMAGVSRDLMSAEPQRRLLASQMTPHQRLLAREVGQERTPYTELISGIRTNELERSSNLERLSSIAETRATLDTIMNQSEAFKMTLGEGDERIENIKKYTEGVLLTGDKEAGLSSVYLDKVASHTKDTSDRVGESNALLGNILDSLKSESVQNTKALVTEIDNNLSNFTKDNVGELGDLTTQAKASASAIKGALGQLKDLTPQRRTEMKQEVVALEGAISRALTKVVTSGIDKKTIEEAFDVPFTDKLFGARSGVSFEEATIKTLEATGKPTVQLLESLIKELPDEKTGLFGLGKSAKEQGLSYIQEFKDIQESSEKGPGIIDKVAGFFTRPEVIAGASLTKKYTSDLATNLQKELSREDLTELERGALQKELSQQQKYATFAGNIETGGYVGLGFKELTRQLGLSERVVEAAGGAAAITKLMAAKAAFGGEAPKEVQEYGEYVTGLATQKGITPDRVLAYLGLKRDVVKNFNEKIKEMGEGLRELKPGEDFKETRGLYNTDKTRLDSLVKRYNEAKVSFIAQGEDYKTYFDAMELGDKEAKKKLQGIGTREGGEARVSKLEEEFSKAGFKQMSESIKSVTNFSKLTPELDKALQTVSDVKEGTTIDTSEMVSRMAMVASLSFLDSLGREFSKEDVTLRKDEVYAQQQTDVLHNLFKLLQEQGGLSPEGISKLVTKVAEEQKAVVGVGEVDTKPAILNVLEEYDKGIKKLQEAEAARALDLEKQSASAAKMLQTAYLANLEEGFKQTIDNMVKVLEGADLESIMDKKTREFEKGAVSALGGTLPTLPDIKPRRKSRADYTVLESLYAKGETIGGRGVEEFVDKYAGTSRNITNITNSLRSEQEKLIDAQERGADKEIQASKKVVAGLEERLQMLYQMRQALEDELELKIILEQVDLDKRKIERDLNKQLINLNLKADLKTGLGVFAGRTAPRRVDLSRDMSELGAQELAQLYGGAGVSGRFMQHDVLSAQASAAEKEMDSIANSIADLLNTIKEARSEGKDTTEFENVLNELNNQLDSAKDKFNNLNTELNESDSVLKVITDTFGRLSKFKFDRSVQTFQKNLQDALESNFNVQTYNTGARGFLGDIGVTTRREDLTDQQYLYSIGSSGMKAALTETKQIQDLMSRTRSDMESVAQSLGTALATQEGLLSDPQASQEQISANALVIQSYEEQLSSLESQFKTAADAVDPMQRSLSSFVALAGPMRQFESSIKAVRAELSYRDSAAIRQFEEFRSTQYGGSSPFAKQFVSAEEQYRASQVGVNLQNLQATQFEKREAELMYSLRELDKQQVGKMPDRQYLEQRRELERQLQFNREDIGRQAEAQIETKRLERLDIQAEPIKEMIKNLQGIKVGYETGTGEFSEEYKPLLGALEATFNKMLADLQKTGTVDYTDYKNLVSSLGEDKEGKGLLSKITGGQLGGVESAFKASTDRLVDSMNNLISPIDALSSSVLQLSTDFAKFSVKYDGKEISGTQSASGELSYNYYGTRVSEGGGAVPGRRDRDTKLSVLRGGESIIKPGILNQSDVVRANATNSAKPILDGLNRKSGGGISVEFSGSPSEQMLRYLFQGSDYYKGRVGSYMPSYKVRSDYGYSTQSRSTDIQGLIAQAVKQVHSKKGNFIDMSGERIDAGALAEGVRVFKKSEKNISKDTKEALINAGNRSVSDREATTDFSKNISSESLKATKVAKEYESAVQAGRRRAQLESASFKSKDVIIGKEKLGAGKIREMYEKYGSSYMFTNVSLGEEWGGGLSPDVLKQATSTGDILAGKNTKVQKSISDSIKKTKASLLDPISKGTGKKDGILSSKDIEKQLKLSKDVDLNLADYTDPSTKLGEFTKGILSSSFNKKITPLLDEAAALSAVVPFKGAYDKATIERVKKFRNIKLERQGIVDPSKASIAAYEEKRKRTPASFSSIVDAIKVFPYIADDAIREAYGLNKKDGGSIRVTPLKVIEDSGLKSTLTEDEKEYYKTYSPSKLADFSKFDKNTWKKWLEARRTYLGGDLMGSEKERENELISKAVDDNIDKFVSWYRESLPQMPAYDPKKRTKDSININSLITDRKGYNENINVRALKVIDDSIQSPEITEADAKQLKAGLPQGIDPRGFSSEQLKYWWQARKIFLRGEPTRSEDEMYKELVGTALKSILTQDKGQALKRNTGGYVEVKDLDRVTRRKLYKPTAGLTPGLEDAPIITEKGVTYHDKGFKIEIPGAKETDLDTDLMKLAGKHRTIDPTKTIGERRDEYIDKALALPKNMEQGLNTLLEQRTGKKQSYKDILKQKIKEGKILPDRQGLPSIISMLKAGLFDDEESRLNLSKYSQYSTEALKKYASEKEYGTDLKYNDVIKHIGAGGVETLKTIDRTKWYDLAGNEMEESKGILPNNVRKLYTSNMQKMYEMTSKLSGQLKSTAYDTPLGPRGNMGYDASLINRYYSLSSYVISQLNADNPDERKIAIATIEALNNAKDLERLSYLNTKNELVQATGGSYSYTDKISIGRAAGGLVPVNVSGGEFAFSPKDANKVGLPILDYINSTGKLPIPYKNGGSIFNDRKKLSNTGSIPGGASPIDDKIATWMPEGSYVVKATSAHKIGIDNLKALTRADGGSVGTISDSNILNKVTSTKVEVVKVDTAEIKEAITSALKSTKLELKDNKVELADNIVELNVDTVRLEKDTVTLEDNKVVLDTEAITVRLESDIVRLENNIVTLDTDIVKLDTKTVSLDTTNLPTSVGAERNDQLAEALDNITSRIDNLDTKIGDIDNIEISNIESMVDTVIDGKIITFTGQIKEYISDELASLDSKITTVKSDSSINTSRISEVVVDINSIKTKIYSS